MLRHLVKNTGASPDAPYDGGAHDWTRTSDLSLTKGVLYRLSYAGMFLCLERVIGIEPTSSAWKAEVLPLNYTRLAFNRLAFNRLAINC